MVRDNRWRRALGQGLLLCTGLLGVGPGQGLLAAQPAGVAVPGVHEDRKAAQKALVGDLHGLAEWCSKTKLYQSREEVFGMVLHFEPDDVVALRGLGFKKDREGNWNPDKRRRPGKNWDKKAAKEYPAKRDAATLAYKDRMLALFETYEAELSPRLKSDILDDVLFADPDDPRVHILRGESKLGEDWVLHATVVAKERRAELKELVRVAFETVPEAREVAATPKEVSFGIEWKAIYATPIVRSLGTGEKEEVERVTQAMWAVHSYFNGALSSQATLPKDLTVYTFAAQPERIAFLQNHPDIDEGYLKFLMPLSGSGIQGSDDFANWSPDVDRRLDGLVRYAIAWMFAGGYQIYSKQGWIFEGFGLYMTRELVGTRLTWFVRTTEYREVASNKALQARLLDTRTNWMAEALKLLRNENRPKLQFLLGKDVNQLSTEDLLYSYVMAAYLVEAESEKLPKILKKIGSGKSSVDALETELGMDLRAFDARLLRWLEERR